MVYRLSPAQKRAIRALYMQGKERKEISKALDIKLGTINSFIFESKLNIQRERRNDTLTIQSLRKSGYSTREIVELTCLEWKFVSSVRAAD